MKLLVDMNLSPRWVALLTDAGLEAAHWSTLGAADAPDSVIMAFAKTHAYTVLTHDLDFSAILAATQDDKPSVVQIRADNANPDNIAGFVIPALQKMAEELEKGVLLTIDLKRSRLRVLPLLSKI
jgi:predicted nuclease of predicted toxin-antitoxin system